MLHMLIAASSGIATGSLLGLLGGGGSIIAVPVLVYLLGFDAKTAVASSLLVVAFASLLAAYSHFRHKAVVVSTALVFGGAGGIGSLAGAQLAGLLSDSVQLTAFALVMALVALLMLRAKPPDIQSDTRSAPLALVLTAGVGAGILTGLLGVGGGFVIVPALTLLLKLPITKAIGTSLLIIAMNSAVGAVYYASRLHFDASILPFALGTLAAAPIAGRLAHRIAQEKLKVSFAISLLLLSGWMLFKEVH